MALDYGLCFGEQSALLRSTAEELAICVDHGMS